MAKFDKPQKGNPHGLTVFQHVFPARSIARFADETGTVALNDVARKLLRRAKPGDDIFCARRAWDQKAEIGYMKDIEDAFQRLVDSILRGSVVRILGDDKMTVSQFFALWYMRARHRTLSTQAIQLIGVTEAPLTQDQYEILEKKGVVAAREDGMLPTRHINAVQLQIKTAHYADQVNEIGKWGVIQAQDGEFLAPDTPSHTIIPLTPKVCLVAGSRNGTITLDNVAKINRAFATTAEKYMFARELSQCPF